MHYLIPFLLKAQNAFELQLNPSAFNGGYSISCYGATDGSVNLIAVGGTAPYTFYGVMLKQLKTFQGLLRVHIPLQ